MKTPTAYGSENEETSFIRRIAAPDRAASNRKQKNRIAVAGATLGFIAATAVVGYSAMRDGSAGDVATASIPTEQLEASTQSAATAGQFVKQLNDAFYPTVAELDTNKNGIVNQREYLLNLEAKKNADLAEILASGLPEEIQAKLMKQVNDNYEIDGPCVVRAMTTLKTNGVIISGSNIKLLYFALDKFCPTTPLQDPKKLVQQFAAEQAAKAAAEKAVADAAAAAKAAEDAATAVPVTTIVVDTPSGPAAIDIPVVKDNEPSTTIVVDTPIGPTVIEVPVAKPDEPSTTIVVDTPTGPVAVDIPIEETSAPATTIVVDTPTGPAVVDIPAVKPDEPSTTIVVDTPTGPAVIELPVAKPDEPSTTIVVDTPTGPVAVDIPVDTPVVTPAISKSKLEFKSQLGSYFLDETANLRGVADRAQKEADRANAKLNLIEACIDQAADKFLAYDDGSNFEKAINWVINDCLSMNN